MELEGKTALVTGATSGAGLEIARRFLEEGAQVCGCGRRESCEISAPDFLYVRGDLTDDDQARAVVARCLEAFGKLDILVNCAGVTGIGGVLDTSPEEFRHQFEVNVFALFHVTRAAVPALEQQPQSAIINIGSELGTRAAAQRIAYCPSKAAVEMLTRCLAIECGPTVRVNGILPGLMETPLTQDRFTNVPDPERQRELVRARYVLKRMCRVEDVAEAALFLAGGRSSFITGDMLAVCGGGQFTTCR